LRFDATRLASCLQEQSVQPWALWNYGSRSAAPVPRWNTEQPEDVNETAEGMSKLGDAITKLNGALQTSGVEVDAIALAEKFGVPLKKRDPVKVENAF
jgi:phage gp29-like protein